LGRSLNDLVFFVGSRLLQLVPVVLGVIVLMFIFTHIAISDPCGSWYPHAKKVVLDQCRSYWGFDQPLYVQFGKYISGLAAGNWGTDQNAQPVYPVIASSLPATLELVLASLLIMIVFGIALGVVAAQFEGRWPDHLVRVFYLSGWAAPTYIVGILLAIYVAPALGFPTGGEFTQNPPPFAQPTHFSVIDAMLAGSASGTLDAIAHLILPAIALAFLNLGIITRMTRTSMLEVLPLDFVKSARMKGISESAVLYRHALRNSLITTTTILGFTASGLLASTVVVEEIFRWPGIGEYSYDAIVNNNFSGLIGVTIVFAIAVVVANLIADILYGLIDPRVEWR
jgi:ABC-type dipeptide/oligopeptide/nickel transport system permease component